MLRSLISSGAYASPKFRQAWVFFLLFLVNYLSCIRNDLCKRGAFQLVFKSRLSCLQSAVHSLMYIASHGTIRIGIFMEMEQPLVIYAVNSLVNIVQRYLVKGF